jgi:3D (Asp-Asp-Asp) domain-containing protein
MLRLIALLVLGLSSQVLSAPKLKTPAGHSAHADPKACLETVVGVRTTAYTHTESDHLEYGRESAAGTPLRFGSVRSAAADWAVIPLGTRFRIKGEEVIYEVDDYGSALVGTSTIDLYRPDRTSMESWGTREVEIEILRWGSFQRSMELVASRLHSRLPHVLAMWSRLKQVLAFRPERTAVARRS